MNRVYNPDIKEEFLSQYDNEQTQKTIRNVFFNTYLVEEVLGKDLYEFTLDELGKAIANTNPATKNVARSNGRFISQYISWCIEPPQRYRKNAINPLKGMLPEWFDKFVDKTKKIHHSYEEFLELLEDEQMHNSQDASFLSLLWFGVIGEKFSQIKSLQYADIDAKNKRIYVKERDYFVDVDDKCIEYIEKTRFENTYYQYNSNTKEFTEKELLPSDFIFKNIRSPRGVENEPIKQNVIYNRLHTIKELLGLDLLSPQSLKQSGMIHMAVELYNAEKELGYEQFAKIGEKYDYSTIVNQHSGERYYNTYLMRNFISEEVISDLYGLNVNITLR